VATALIDLDRDWSVAEDQPRRRPAPRHRVLVLGVLLALLLAGSVAAPPPRLRAVLTVQGSVGMSFLIADQTLYLAVREDPGGWRLTAYRLPGGTIRWSTALDEPAHGIVAMPEAQVVLFAAVDPPTGVGHVQAVSAATGQRLWRRGDVTRVLRLDSASLLLTSSGATGLPQVQSIDARSGRLLWSRTVAIGGAQAFVPPDGSGGHLDRIVLMAPDGITDVIAAHSGRVLITGRLDVPPAAQQLATLPGRALSALGYQIVLWSYQRDGVPTIVAYDLDTLTERWRVTQPNAVYNVGACGPVVCVAGKSGLSAVAADTGRVLWRTATQWSVAEPAGHWLLASGMRPYGTQALLDPRTGQVRLDLTGWSPPISSVDSSTLLVTEPSPDRNDRVRIAALDLAVPALRPLGSLTPVQVNECRNTASYLACSTPDLRVQVLRYRR
jgi:outer membrane protein assembly factor BamB